MNKSTRDEKKFPHKVGDLYYSDKQVLRSAAGYFIGTTCWDEDYGGFEDMGSRESGYYETKEAAEKALKLETYDRICEENIFAYKQGFPRRNK